MRQSVHDFGIKFERGKDLEDKFKEKGFASIPSERVRGAHFPSDLTDCMRKRWYNFKGFSETNSFTFQTRCTLALGSLFDDLIVKMSMRARVYVEDEFSFGFNLPQLKYPVSGRIDIVIEEPDGTLVPAEVKSTKSSGFYDQEYKWANGRGKSFFPGAISEPKLAHVAQLMTYIYKMGGQFGYLIYFCKDNSDFCVHKVYWSQELFDHVVKDAALLEDYLALDTVPPRPEDVRSISLEFYQRDATYGKKGDIKSDSLKYPCAFKDRDTGEVSFCKYFMHCYAKEILEAPEAGEHVKEQVRLFQQAELAKVASSE